MPHEKSDKRLFVHTERNCKKPADTKWSCWDRKEVSGMEAVNKEIEEKNSIISLGIETLESIIKQFHRTDSRKADLETARERMKKFSITVPKYEGVCPDCSTHNPTWIQRSNTVKKDFVYCWHCGKRVFIEHKQNEGK